MGISNLIPTSGVKSVQRGLVDFTNKSNETITISIVDTSKTVVHVYGSGRIEKNSTSDITSRTYQIRLVSSTSINIFSYNFGLTSTTGTIDGTVGWQVVEYY